MQYIKRHIVLAALFLLGLAAAALEFNAPGATIVPSVKKSLPAEGSYAIPADFEITAPAQCEMALEMLGKTLAERGVRVTGKPGTSNCVFAVDPSFTDPEGYKLAITPGGIRVTAGSARGLFYGAQTLISLIRGAKDGRIACRTIEDWPDLKVRGMHFTMRYLDSTNIADVKRVVRALASLKYNTLLLEFADNFPYKDNPFTLRKTSVTRAELEDLTKWIYAHKIEIIPQIQLISHVRALSTHPRFKEFLEAPTKLASLHDAAYCPSNDEVNELVKKMIREQLEFFKPKVFDVCFDEIADCPFRVCPKCKARKAEEILRSQLDMAANLIFAAGAVPQLYQDSFLPGKVGRGEFVLPKLDRRYRICYWSYVEQPSPTHRVFTELGFPVVTMPLAGDPVNTVAMVKYAKDEKLAGTILTFWYHWHHRGPKLLPWTAAGYGGLVTGAELCWNPDGDRGRLPCDPVQEMRFRLGFRETARTSAKFAPLPLAAAVNAKLGANADFPVYHKPEGVAALKKELADAPEKFELLTEGSSYYGILLSGSKNDANKRQGMLIGVKAKVKEFALLLSTARPNNTAKFIPRGKFGVHSTPEVASITLNYADGTKHVMPLNYRETINDWNSEFGGLKMRQLQRDADDLRRIVSFGVATLVNPHPDQKVDTITFSTKQMEGIAPLLLAISVNPAQSFVPQKINPGRIAVKGPGVKAKNTDLFNAANDAPGKVKVRLILEGKANPREFMFRNRILPVSVAQDADGGKVLRFTVPAMPKSVSLQRVIIQLPIKGIDPSNRSIGWEFRPSDPALHKWYGIFIGSPMKPNFPHIAFFDHSRLGTEKRSGEVSFKDMRQEGLQSVADAEEVWLSFWLINDKPITIDLYRIGVSNVEGKFQSAPRTARR